MLKMILKKSEIRALICIYRGASSREQIAHSLKVSVNMLSPLLKRLELLDFVSSSRENRKLIIQPSKTEHAHALKRMLILEPGTKYEGFLYGLNFRMLSCCLYSEKPITTIAEQLDISKKTVLNRSKQLRDRMLLVKNKQMLSFNKKSWTYLYDFLSACRNYTKKLNNVLWKFEDEVLFEAEETDINGALTGFSAYHSFNIPIYVIKFACFLPEKRLSKEEVFIHSLLQIREETRLLEASAAFFYKNKPNRNKLIGLAYKYDCIDILNDFFKVVEAKEGKIITDALPPTSVQGIKEMCKTYGVKVCWLRKRYSTLI